MRKTLLTAAAVCFLGAASAGVALFASERTAGEIIRYSERRLIGHPRLEAILLPLLEGWRAMVERPVLSRLPSLAKGQQNTPLPAQTYDQYGAPVPVRKGETGRDAASAGPNRIVGTIQEIQRALEEALPGQSIEIRPGVYRMDRSLRLHNGGTPDRPIVVKAKRPGTVIIQSSAAEGFHLHGPYWIIENLTIKGICHEHSNCEHAFHIVGKARGIVIRNNRIEDFNAQIKVNGLDGHWPDNGLIQHNNLANSTSRETSHSVTPIDIVGASGWQVVDNLIRHFVKAGGNKTSYGVFMKGGGERGVIARNLIVCADRDLSKEGTRVGISFGGGGTDPRSCRNQRCVTEHSLGIAAGNLVADCNDFGIYVNKANQTLIARNMLANTYGIDVRFAVSSATVTDNLLDGAIRARDGALLSEKNNSRWAAWTAPETATFAHYWNLVEDFTAGERRSVRPDDETPSNRN